MDVVNKLLLQGIVERIRQAIHVEKIILFGSYAWGVPNRDSDIDLFVIVKESPQPGYRRARDVYRCLRDISVPIDVIVKTQEEVQQSANVVTSLTRKCWKKVKCCMDKATLQEVEQWMLKAKHIFTNIQCQV